MDNFLWTDLDGHVPVLLAEVVEALAPRNGAVYVDGTFGGGGYSRAIADAADCRVIGFDRDPDVHNRAETWLNDYPAIRLLHARFGDMLEALAGIDIVRVDGIVLDLGVSSFQLDQAERGFSFQTVGPLDMRMSREGTTAADIVNASGEQELADLIYRYGDERASRRIARAIVRAREEMPFDDTKRLADTIARAVRSPATRGSGRDKVHPATRTFQALRIAVNDELGELERALDAAERLLADQGRLVVVSFHSGEDRIVKNFIDQRSGRSASVSRHMPETGTDPVVTFEPLGRRASKASDDEISRNPRARSARLRAARRVRPQGGGDRPVDERMAA